ncbi:MAG: hypothetical protein WCA34_04860 [Candidatus Acidiferrales bacterium]
MRDVDIVSLPATLHFHAFSAVHVHQFEIIAWSTSCPSLVRTTVPGKLLYVGSIGPAIASDVQYQAAIDVSNGILAVAQVNKFPTLIVSAIAGELLYVGILARAAAEDVNAFSRIDIAD